MHNFYSKIAGVTFNNENSESRQKIILKFCRSHKPLYIVREFDNPYTKNKSAIALYVEGTTFFFFTNRYKVGYLSNKVSKSINDYLDNGDDVKIWIADVTGGEKNYGVNIHIEVTRKYD